MHLVIIGGGVFPGAALLDTALARGHDVSVFNRGRSRQRWPDGVRSFVGERRADLFGLTAAGPFDAVIDTCGYCPADVLPSAEVLAGCPRYQFVSSISAFAAHDRPGITEAAALASAAGMADDAAVTGDSYGPLKAQCERVLAQRLGQCLQVIRPGLIVGPGDPTGRFSYWPWRAAAGGRMLVPDVPPPARLQFIDVRDLASWMVTLLERTPGGAYNATGRAGEVDWPMLIHACQRAVRATGRDAAEAVPVSERVASEAESFSSVSEQRVRRCPI
jgi:2'-hydroxyisoflavone reductase